MHSMHCEFNRLSPHFHHSSHDIRPGLNERHSPDDKTTDEASLPTTEDPHTNDDQPSLAHHTASPSLKVRDETNGKTSGSQQKKISESWKIHRNEVDNTSRSDSQDSWMFPPFTLTEEAVISRKDGRSRFQQLDYEAFKTGGIRVPLSVPCCDADSLRPKRNLAGEEGVELMVEYECVTEAGTEQMSNTERGMQDGVMWKEGGQRDGNLPIGKANGMVEIGLLGTNYSSALKGNWNLSPKRIVDSISGCDAEGEIFSGKDRRNVENKVNRPEEKEAEDPPQGENEAAPGVCPSVISLSSDREDNEGNCSQPENTDVQQHTETSETETNIVPGVNATENPERTTGETTDAVEGGAESRTETLVDNAEDSGVPGRGAGSGESGIDRGEAAPPVDSEGCTATGKGTMGLISKKNTSTFQLFVF